MLYATNIFPGDNTTRQFELTFVGGYLDKSHIVAYYEDNLSKVQTPIDPGTITWLGPYTVQLPPGAQASVGTNVVFARQTPREPLVDFQGSSRITEANLDLAHRQGLFVAVESLDSSNSEVVAQLKDIIIGVQEVADEALLSAAASAASAAESASSAGVAGSQASQAMSSATAAQGQATAASGSAATALTYRNDAEGFKNTAVASASAAATSEANALAYRNTASGHASAALGSANAASSSAAAALASQNAAASSASSASASAAIATTQATNANTSAGNAAYEVTLATTQRNLATSAANAAGVFAVDAQNAATAAASTAQQVADNTASALASKNAAAASALSAATSATQSANSATAAGTAKTAAETALASAISSATTAGDSAATATTQAGIATSKATQAANSATTAGQSQTAAAASAVAAAASVTSIQGATGAQGRMCCRVVVVNAAAGTVRLERCGGTVITLNGSPRPIPAEGVTLTLNAGSTPQYLYAGWNGSYLTLIENGTVPVFDTGLGQWVFPGNANYAPVAYARQDGLASPSQFLRNYYNAGPAIHQVTLTADFTANWDSLQRQLITFPVLLLPGDTIDLDGVANIMSTPSGRVGDLVVKLSDVVLARARNTHVGDIGVWQNYKCRTLIQRGNGEADPAGQVNFALDYFPISNAGNTWIAQGDGSATRLIVHIIPYKWA